MFEQRLVCELHLGIQGYHNSCISSPHEACQRTVFLKYRKVPKYEWLLDGRTARRTAGISSTLAITSLKTYEWLLGVYASFAKLKFSSSVDDLALAASFQMFLCAQLSWFLAGLHPNIDDCFFNFCFGLRSHRR